MATENTTIQITETSDALAVPATQPGLVRRSAASVRRAWQRGMATAEYAVGILAAVALALVLLKIFNDNEFFTTMLRFVLDLIGRVGGMVG